MKIDNNKLTRIYNHLHQYANYLNNGFIFAEKHKGGYKADFFYEMINNYLKGEKVEFTIYEERYGQYKIMDILQFLNIELKLRAIYNESIMQSRYKATAPISKNNALMIAKFLRNELERGINEF